MCRLKRASFTNFIVTASIGDAKQLYGADLSPRAVFLAAALVPKTPFELLAVTAVSHTAWAVRRLVELDCAAVNRGLRVRTGNIDKLVRNGVELTLDDLNDLSNRKHALQLFANVARRSWQR
jgi:hypothetical protein